MTPVLSEYLPVNKLDLVGAQTGETLKLLKRILSLANLSKFGVIMWGLPL